MDEETLPQDLSDNDMKTLAKKKGEGDKTTTAKKKKKKDGSDNTKDGDKKRKAASSPVKANVASTKKPPCATKGKAGKAKTVCFFVVFIRMKSYALTTLRIHMFGHPYELIYALTIL